MNNPQERRSLPPERAGDRGTGAWSPMLIALIALVFSSGGAILTVQNLYRLQQMDKRQAQKQAAAILIIFSLGYGILVALSASSSSTSQDTTGSVLISVAVAVGSFAVQARPYREMQLRATGPRASWLQAVGYAFLYELATLILAVPVTEITRALLTGTG